jgi:Vitamin B6 photo-protection and homoeostasis
MMSQLKIRELDEAGRQIRLYVAHGTKSSIERVDTINLTNHKPLAERILAVFLPTGYPDTVSPDYTAYHVYNSLQAFFSAIAALLASRAVLQGMGVGDQEASATSAMLLTVLQESMGRFATILFAYRVGTTIESECKMYRLLADVLNDTAMVFDCLSPMLPKLIRVPLLGASSIVRAMCGVAGQSSKAALSAHFARTNNIGEINAKVSSQETFISLLGMWVGGIVVSYAKSTTATWIWLALLLVTHLWTNYLAVSTICLNTINRQRANDVFSSLIEDGKAPSPQEVGHQERIFEKDGMLRWKGKVIGLCRLGVSLAEFLQGFGRMQDKTGSMCISGPHFQDVLDTFSDEQYLLWIDAPRRRAFIVLFENATVKSQMKAWSHALRAMQVIELTKGHLCMPDVLKIITSSLSNHDVVFDDWIRKLEVRGWNTSTPAIATTAGNRIVLDHADGVLPKTGPKAG